MKKNLKKTIAMGMAAAMMIGSCFTVFGDDLTADTQDQEITGAGSEIYVNMNVMKVTVPTTLNNLFDYKVDPQGLVAQTKSFSSDGDVTSVMDSSGVLFFNSGGTASNTSDVVKITNKSAIPVELGIKVKASLPSGASNTLALDKLATSDEFTGDNAEKALYLGLITTNDTERAITGTETTYNNILLTAADQYEVTFTSGAHAYALKSDATFDDFEFSVTGAINKNIANTTWATVSSAGTVTINTPPSISVKFSLTKVADAKEASTLIADNVLYVWNANAADASNGELGGTDGTTAPSVVKINGTAVSKATVLNGYVVVQFEDIAARFGYTSTEISAMKDDEKAKVIALVKAVSVQPTANGVVYYGEIE